MSTQSSRKSLTKYTAGYMDSPPKRYRAVVINLSAGTPQTGRFETAVYLMITSGAFQVSKHCRNSLCCRILIILQHKECFRLFLSFAAAGATRKAQSRPLPFPFLFFFSSPSLLFFIFLPPIMVQTLNHGLLPLSLSLSRSFRLTIIAHSILFPFFPPSRSFPPSLL